MPSALGLGLSRLHQFGSWLVMECLNKRLSDQLFPFRKLLNQSEVVQLASIALLLWLK